MIVSDIILFINIFLDSTMELNFVLLFTIVLINKATSLSYNDVGKCKNVASNPSFILAQVNVLKQNKYYYLLIIKTNGDKH